MDQELKKLEQILNQVTQILTKKPAKTRRLQMPTGNKIPVENIQIPMENTGLIEENSQHKKRIKELNGKLLQIEKELEETKMQVENLNAVNFELKVRERELKTDILEIKGAIRVVCRIRPALNNPLDSLSIGMRFDNKNVFIDNKRYALNNVLGPKSTQSEVFSEIQHEIDGVLEGYNVCIFAYGQTGSGKTYTMCGEGEEEGLMFRSLRRIKDQGRSLINDGFSVKYNVKYVEVYNENIRDLITDRSVSITHDALSVRLKGCEEMVFEDPDQVSDIVRSATLKRMTAETNCNSQSSRSHAIFILGIMAESPKERREGGLCLIDLAGSERLKESKAANERLKEVQFINKSLSALGNVIVALKKKDRHVPFRDSKLTHLMQEYLTGKSRTLMIVNINPESLDESVCSLRFATKVSECNLGEIRRNINWVV